LLTCSADAQRPLGDRRICLPSARSEHPSSTTRLFVGERWRRTFSLPAIAAGLLAGHIGLQAASVGYGLLLVALGCLALVLMARSKA
jgi:hypothetical protein